MNPDTAENKEVDQSVDTLSWKDKKGILIKEIASLKSKGILPLSSSSFFIYLAKFLESFKIENEEYKNLVSRVRVGLSISKELSRGAGYFSTQEQKERIMTKITSLYVSLLVQVEKFALEIESEADLEYDNIIEGGVQTLSSMQDQMGAMREVLSERKTLEGNFKLQAKILNQLASKNEKLEDKIKDLELSLNLQETALNNKVNENERLKEELKKNAK